MKKIFFTTSTLLGIALLSCSQVSAASTAGFEAGRIIDDLVFTYYQSMNVDQIQTFLNSKVPICDNWGTNGSTPTARRDYFIAKGYPLPLTCLKDYVENGKTSSQIIYDTAQTYKINPQVLIVLLQKEQGLVTDDWPDPTQYRSATGYGCPDTAACDTSYYGFTNQVNNAANMFRKILDNSPNWYTPYKLGNNYIQYNPNTSCGGTVVNIQNRSTQALYNYTPYQPNASALAAGYGSGDYCGAYGNRNFYLYFTDWFGSTRRELITSNASGIYMVENGSKRAFPNEETFLSYSYKWSSVTNISYDEISLIPDGDIVPYNTHYRDSNLVMNSGGVYLIENGTKRAVPNEEIFISNSYAWPSVITISQTELSMIPEGAAVPYNVNYRNGKLILSNGGVYLIENGTKRAFPSELIFSSHLYKWTDIITISQTELSMIPEGAAVPYNVNYRNGKLILSNGGVYLIENGTKRAFPSEEIFNSYSYTLLNTLSISATELSFIPEGIPVDYYYGQKSIVSSQGGGIYLIENGKKRAFPNELIFFSHKYNWSDVKIISSSQLSKIDEGEAMIYNVNSRNGEIISTIGYGVYFIENGKKRAFPNETIFLSYSLPWSNLKKISNYEFNLIPEGEPMLTKST